MSSKSLKDIVEEGFLRLAVLSDKRKELISRCDELASGTGSRESQQGQGKLESSQAAYGSEINTYVERSQDVLQQTLSQIVEDNERFLSSVKENLQLRIESVLKEMSYNREALLEEAKEKFESQIRPLERELEAGRTDLRFEAVKLLGELEALCKRSHSALHEAQADVAGKLSASEHELTGSLGSDFGALVQESERRRQQVTESLEKLYGEQSFEMAKLTEETDERISSVVNMHLSTVKQLGEDAESSLGQTCEQIVSASAAEIVSLSQESFSELEASYEFSHKDLSDKLSDLRNQTNRLLNQVKEFLSEHEAGTKENGEKLAQELKNRPAYGANGGSAIRSPIDETIEELSRELDTSASDFKKQLSELLRIQQERLSSLCSGAENAIAAAASALNAELTQIIRMHEQTWNDREQELLSRLKKMESEADETSALVAESAGDEDDVGESEGSV